MHVGLIYTHMSICRILQFNIEKFYQIIHFISMLGKYSSQPNSLDFLVQPVLFLFGWNQCSARSVFALAPYVHYRCPMKSEKWAAAWLHQNISSSLYHLSTFSLLKPMFSCMFSLGEKEDGSKSNRMKTLPILFHILTSHHQISD